MNAVFVSAIMASLMAQHGYGGTVLCRASVVADRCSIVLAALDTLSSSINLARSACDGPGYGVIVASADIHYPWHPILLRYPAGVFQRGRRYPDVLLRHSYSRYGLHVAGYAQNDDFVSMVTASLTSLEQVNQLMIGPGGRLELYAWNGFGLYSGTGPLLTPLSTPFLEAKRVMYYDFSVSPAAECELFIAQPDGGVELLTKSVLPSRQVKVPGGNEAKPWTKRFRVPAAVTGPFAVVPHERSRYLVTPARTVVKICDDGKPLPKAASVYDKAPVLAVVHDADEGKWYAFTAAHYFEVAEPVVLKPHAVKKFDTSNGAAGLETAFHCGRAVRGLPPVLFPAAK